MAKFWDIEELDTRKRDAQEQYVRRFGWEITCNTPGSYWLWSRDFAREDAERHARWKDGGPGPSGRWPSEPKPYGRITADLNLAVSMTRRTLDNDPEEMEDE